MKFLMGLHDSFTNIKAQIILLKPPPSLSEVYALVQQEEKHKQLSNLPISSYSLAFTTRNHFTYNKDPTKQSGHSLEKCFKANPNLEKPICTHCNLARHTVDRCYKLHGYPPGHKTAAGRRCGLHHPPSFLPLPPVNIPTKFHLNPSHR
ncbi:hypothetical protein I3843_12G013900 [Carya illinoinensis]|nr:hypothetical protein I3843_12G013900 [Carya illinoinensis]